MKIYHNPRCRKSRETLELIENEGKEVEIVKYLETIPSKDELINLINLLGIKPIDLVRKNEAIWKEHYKGKALSDSEIVNVMLSNPKLIERPIVVSGNKAVLGRPPQNVLSLF
ncbi:MAG: arsenate reductase (glutaredoxin) [Flavobacteriaceae bacterium]|nr:arsenate reductase (glutaredoxin) [Flavobacteriaceae bacterium]